MRSLSKKRNMRANESFFCDMMYRGKKWKAPLLRVLFLLEAHMVIKWVTTPTCKECKFYDSKKKQCALKQCAYKDKR